MIKKTKNMKKVLSVFILAAVLLMSAEAGAQIKIGYIRIDDMVASMPETAKIDSILEKYQADSINPRYAQIVSLYQYKDSVYRDSVKPAPPAVKKQIEEELPSLIYQIQNWQQIVNQAIEARQNGSSARFALDRKVMTKEALLIAPDADDMIGLVAAKLKVTLPKAK